MGQIHLGRRSLIMGSLAASALLASGCSKASNPIGTSNAKREITIGATIAPETMDLSSNTAAAIPELLLYNLYETLVKVDADGRVRPLLASAWTISDDRMTYTFTIQKSAKFASGTDLTAQAVVDSLEYMRKSAVGKPQLALVSSVAAVDQSTVEVKLSKPSRFFLYTLSSTAGVVIDPAGTSTMATQPLGSGPYAFESWTKGASVTLKRNPEYWGTPPKFDKVTFRYFSDPNAMNSAMLAGDLDIISNVAAPQTLSQFNDSSRFTIIEGTTNGEVVLGFNHKTPALADVKVRQAINHAIDRQAVVDTVWGGKGKLIGSMVAPTDPWFEDLSGTYAYDPAKAKQLLAEAGKTNLTLRLRVPNIPYATGAVALLTQQLKDVGITLKTDQLDFYGGWLPQVYTKGDYDLTIIAHVEPRDLVNWADPNYYWHYNNPAFTKLITEADAASEEDSDTKLKEAAKLLADDAAGSFLFLLPNLIVTTPDISGVSANATSLAFDLTMIASRNS